MIKKPPKPNAAPSKQLQSGIDAIAASYDAYPYHSVAFAQTSPTRLHVVATLFGHTPPDIATARVLEIGCAAGGNIIPWALAYPKAQVVGIDISKTQVAEGQRNIAALGLTNIRIEQRSATDIPADFGEFDYIVCHGVYSWVPDEVQEAIFAIAKHHLSKTGIAYISYNTYPGWKSREIVRDAMRMRAHKGGDNPRQQMAYARGMVEFLADVAPKNELMHRVMTEFHATLQTSSESYLIHEFLEIHNNPCYFKDFANRAAAHQLVYLAEAEPVSMFLSNYGSRVADLLLKECSSGQLEIEQYLDFVTNRPFRQTLLMHALMATQTNYTITETAMLKLHLRGFFTEASSDAAPFTFTTARGNTLTAPASWQRDALQALSNAYPSTLAVADIVAQEKAVDKVEMLGFLNLLVILNAVSYTAAAMPCVPAKGYAPNHLPKSYAPAVALAKLWLNQSSKTEGVEGEADSAPDNPPCAIVNAWHEHAVLTKSVAQALILADGTQTCDQIQQQAGVNISVLYGLGLISA